MNLRDISGFSFRALKERKQRSILTIFMVSIGIALITALNGLGGGINGFITDQFSTLAPNVLTVTPTNPLNLAAGGGQGGFGGGVGNDNGPRVTLTPFVVRNLVSVPGVTDVVPSYTATIQLTSGGKVQTTRLIGIDTHKLRLIIPTMELESGELIDQSDVIE